MIFVNAVHHGRPGRARMHIAAHRSPSIRVSVPFLVSVGLDRVVRHPGWIAIIDAVLAGLDAGSHVAVVGGPGLGKSLLLRLLKRDFLRAGRHVVLLPGEASVSTRSTDIVLVDEADRVPAPLLHELSRRAPRCVLAGSGELLAALGQFSGNPVVVEMQPLPPGGVGPYLLEQVERAGWPRDLLAHDAIASLAHHSAGNPHRLQMLASRALLLARLQDADQVSESHVRLAAAHYGDARSGSAFDTVGPLCDAPEPNLASVVPHLQPSLALRSLAGPQDTAQGSVPAIPAFRVLRPRFLVPAGAVCGLALTGAVIASRHGQPSAAAMPSPGTVLASAGPATIAVAPLPQAARQPDAAMAVATPPAGAAPSGRGGVGPSAAENARLSVPAPAAADDGASNGQPARSITFSGLERGEPDLAEAVATPSEPEPIPALVPPGSQLAGAGEAGVAQVAAAPETLPQASGSEEQPPAERVAALPPPVATLAALPRPASVPLHVVVAAARNDSAAESRGAALVGAFEADGMRAALVLAQLAPNEPAVAYFYPSDHAAAAQVARRVGEAGHEQLVAPHGIPPRPGTIQISVPASRPPARRGHDIP